LKEPWELKKPSKIFVCSVSDLFAPWTPTEWRDAVLKSIFECPVKHTFQLLTKNPERIPPIRFPDNVWVGATVTNEDVDYRNIAHMNFVQAKIRFISFEPLLGPLPAAVTLKEMQWVIIGKLTGSRKVELKEAWVEDIVEEAKRHGIPVFIKNNILKEHPSIPKIQEFPK
jgi:protein gp37